MWRGKQSTALLDTTRYLDIEGAIRSSKTTIGLWKVLNACLERPGMRWLVARWIDDDVHALLVPLLRLIFENVGLDVQWFADEHRFELPNGSWIYVRGLRPSENTSRFSKFRGMTLGGVFVDQADEIPEDFYLELKGRLSQVGYPCQMILAPNPPGEDHWIAREFPDTESGLPAKPQHSYIRLSLYDNAHNLPPEYVAQLERDYPVGHPMRRRLIEGKRGLNVRGKPVYAGYFDRARHVADVGLVADVPLIESIDFGHHHPCVVWLQFLPWGECRWLGALMGEDCYIEDFAPLIVQYRAHWFGGYSEVWSCCDPAGSHENSQGTKKNGVSVLREHDIAARSVPNSNMPDVRDFAIQTIAGYMRRRTMQGEAFAVSRKRRWMIVSSREARDSTVVTDALEAGYVYDDRQRQTSGGRTLIVPLKDGFYEHSMNCAEYAVLNYGPGRQSVKDERRAVAQMQAALTKSDRDPMDRYYNRHQPNIGRGGSYGTRAR